MKFTYEFIKENLRIYNEAKSLLPIITQFENGEVSYNAMRSIKLEQFADFFNFLKYEKGRGFELIQAVSFKELKQIICDNTNHDRFKKLFQNITQPTFKKLLTEDPEKFDRYLNGRWVTKPGYNSRGRRSYGKRSSERVDGLNTAFVALINWLISNDIETIEKFSSTYKSFSNQEAYSSRMKYFNSVVLSLDNIPQREIDITSKLLTSLVDFIEDSEIDFRKLNSDFIIENLSNKIRKLMDVPKGTTLVSLVDKNNDYGRQVLTKNKNYIVESSNIASGFIRILVKDDQNYNNYFDYKLFEDISLQRDILLSQLGII